MALRHRPMRAADVRECVEIVAALSLLKMSSGANVFEISDIQEDEAEAVQ